MLPLADLGDLSGLENGGKNPTAMVDGTFCIPYFVFYLLYSAFYCGVLMSMVDD